MLPCRDPRGSVFGFGGAVDCWDCCAAWTGSWIGFTTSQLVVCSMTVVLLEATPKVMRKCVGFRPMHVTATKWQLILNASCDFRFTDSFVSNSVVMDAANLIDCMSNCVTSTNGRLRISSFVEGEFVEMTISHSSGKENNKYVDSISFFKWFQIKEFRMHVWHAALMHSYHFYIE